MCIDIDLMQKVFHNTLIFRQKYTEGPLMRCQPEGEVIFFLNSEGLIPVFNLNAFENVDLELKPQSKAIPILER